MNDDKLDRIFEEAFKVEYRKEFKQELKDMLLKEYDKRKKGRFFLRISTVVAACIVLAVVAFGALKLDIMSLNVPDTSYVENEIEQFVRQQDKDSKQKAEQSSKSLEKNSVSSEEKSLQKEDILEKKQEQKPKPKQSSKMAVADNKQQAASSASAEKSEKKTEEKNNRSLKKLSQNTDENKKSSNSKTKGGIKSSKNSSTKKSVKSSSSNNSKESSQKISELNSQNSASAMTVSATEASKEAAKKQFDIVVNEPEQRGSESVFVLKEEDVKVDKEYILSVLSEIVSGDIYEKSSFRVQNIVRADVYEGYLNFEVEKSAAEISIFQFLQEKLQESVVDTVYATTELILQTFGIKDYEISVFSQQGGYRAKISLCFDGYKIFGADSYIDYSSGGNVVNGKIYLKSFSKVKSLRIMDAKSAAEEFKKRYNLKSVDPADVTIVYKKIGEVYMPVYIYIYENKIYWLEK
uniref:Uncharacterized protein n=1 Tax=Caldicellulosiruptor owensensis TaxID=55205 RepID=A0A7C5ZD67_9FIRM